MWQKDTDRGRWKREERKRRGEIFFLTTLLAYHIYWVLFYIFFIHILFHIPNIILCSQYFVHRTFTTVSYSEIKNLIDIDRELRE